MVKDELAEIERVHTMRQLEKRNMDMIQLVDEFPFLKFGASLNSKNLKRLEMA